MGTQTAQKRSTVTQIWIHSATPPPTSPRQTTEKWMFNHQNLMMNVMKAMCETDKERNIGGKARAS